MVTNTHHFPHQGILREEIVFTSWTQTGEAEGFASHSTLIKLKNHKKVNRPAVKRSVKIKISN